MREVIVVAPRGFCAGVTRAIDSVRLALQRFGAPVYVRRAIVHNAAVVSQLAEEGAVFVDELEQVPTGAPVVFSAHGVSQEVRRIAQQRDLQVVDATCPLVDKVHQEALRFLADGYQVVLIGHAGHDETLGTMGQSPGQIRLLTDENQVALLPFEPSARVAYVTQTTLSTDQVLPIVAALKQRFPLLTSPRIADICYATQNRQEAAQWLAGVADAVLVLGDLASSNATRLREVAVARGVRALLAPSIQDVPDMWIEGVDVLGLTSGASTPEILVQEAVARFSGMGARVRYELLATEQVTFSLPQIPAKRQIPEVAL